jgi:hypothetical protein
MSHDKSVEVSSNAPTGEDRRLAAAQSFSPNPVFAATLLCALELIELDSDRLSPAKVAAVKNAI